VTHHASGGEVIPFGLKSVATQDCERDDIYTTFVALYIIVEASGADARGA